MTKEEFDALMDPGLLAMQMSRRFGGDVINAARLMAGAIAFLLTDENAECDAALRDIGATMISAGNARLPVGVAEA